MQYLPDINNIITNNWNFIYPPGKQPFKYTNSEIRVICHNQFLAGQDKFPNFYINKFSLNPYSYPPRILKAGEVVLCTSLYTHVLIISGVLDRNGECTIQTEDSGFYRVNLESLLWIQHFTPSAPINHRIKRCAQSTKKTERFYGPSLN